MSAVRDQRRIGMTPVNVLLEEAAETELAL